MKALREAFSKVMSDPDVLVDARKKGLEPAAVSGDELEGLVKELVQPPGSDSADENISPE
jgi:tripartite-type tricarboxylate transporter receptor subunit TctC